MTNEQKRMLRVVAAYNDIFRTERLQDDIQDLIDAIDMLQTVRELRRH